MALILLPGDAQCVHCGCTDSQACANGCSWIAVDRVRMEGVCSNCVCERCGEIAAGKPELVRIGLRVVKLCAWCQAELAGPIDERRPRAKAKGRGR
jgi:hypothetical protein